MSEFWNLIPGHLNYEASTLGRIRSPRRVLKQSIDTGGYPTVTLGHRGQHRVHCLVILTFEGPPPEGKEVCHRDGVFANVKLDNLYYGTRKQNIQDAVHHGTAWWLKVPDTCPKGHSDIVRYGGKYRGRICRTCKNDYQNRRRAELRCL